MEDSTLQYQEDKTFSEMFLTAKGRLNRLRYFKRMLVLGIVEIISTTLISSAFFDASTYDLSTTGYILTAVVFIVIAPMQYLLFIRRLHDLDKTGWLSLLMLVPVLNALLGLYLLFASGTVGHNQYGADPLEGKR